MLAQLTRVHPFALLWCIFNPQRNDLTVRRPMCTQPTARIWPSRAWQKLSSPKVLLANPERGPRILIARAGVEPQSLHDIDTI